MEVLKILYSSSERSGAASQHFAAAEEFLRAEDSFRANLSEQLLAEFENLTKLNELLCEEERYHEFVSGFAACASIAFELLTTLQKEK